MLWERVIDTHDAGNTVRKADSDFKLTIRGNHPGFPLLYFIECKASVQYRSLTDNGARRSLIKGDQIAKMRMALRAGVAGLYFFHDVEGGRIEIWDAVPVIEAWGKKRYTWVANPLFQMKEEDFPDWAESLVKNATRHFR